MREGAWINANTGNYEWITEHASWIQNPLNAKRIGLPGKVFAHVASLLWDFNGEGRKAILLAVMQHGFIRLRGHGESATFESTLPLMDMVRASQKFMTDNFGPLTGCRFNDLARGKSFSCTYAQVQLAIERGQLESR